MHNVLSNKSSSVGFEPNVSSGILNISSAGLNKGNSWSSSSSNSHTIKSGLASVMWIAHQTFILVESGAVMTSGKTSGPEFIKSEESSRIKSKCSYRFSACSSDRILQKSLSANNSAGEYPINSLEFYCS